MCSEKELVMPSVDMFLQRHKNPKSYIVFYEYFLKSVVGRSDWMKNLGDPFTEATMFATPSNEAFTLLCLENGEVEWLRMAKKKNGLTFDTDHDKRAKDKQSLVEHILEWEFDPSVEPGMEGFIKDPTSTSSEDLQLAAGDRMIIEEAVLATLKPLPANYLDDDDNTEQAGEGNTVEDNDSPPNRKRKRMSFKKYTNERCGRKRFGGWTDTAINQMIARCVSIRQDRNSKRYLNMEKAYHLWAGEREFGKDGKKRPQERTSPQARPINTSNAWDLDFMNSREAASAATQSNVENEVE
jgi:hypothetical protein